MWKSVIAVLAPALCFSFPSLGVCCESLTFVRQEISAWRTINPPGSSGNYCLNSDMVAPKVYGEGWGDEISSLNGTFLELGVSDLTLDLRGFKLNAESAGTKVIGMDLVRNRTNLRSISIVNGAIVSRTSSGIILGLSDRLRGSLRSDFVAVLGGKLTGNVIEDVYGEFLSVLPKSRDLYNATNHRIQDLKISANAGGVRNSRSVGVAILGAKNIIRGNTIVVENGQAGLYLFGPDQLIENNVIIYRGRALAEGFAPIRLHHGDNSIIRNNEIIVEGASGERADAAISVFDSRNVLVTGNRIKGARQLVKVFGDSSVSENENEMKR